METLAVPVYYTQFFTDNKEVNQNQVGTKALNLIKMSQQGLKVPNGFVVLSDAFKQEMTRLNGDKDILKTSFDTEFEKELYSQFERLQNEGYESFAVRSSAVAEDMDGASFAGQYETYLNVRTFDELTESIKKCWNSFFSNTVQSYSKEKNIEIKECEMGVVVQGMVNADVSGVIFSINPVSEDKNEIIINSSYGLGEAIVSGMVTPDMFIVSKDSDDIQSELGLKEMKIVYSNVGTQEVRTTVEEQSQLSINESIVHELKELTIGIEGYYGNHVDIEFAIKDSQIFVLQVRPITT